MKITLESLRRIITEEVIKEELDPEHAVPAISAMLKGMEATETSEVFGDVFTVLYGEEALEAEAEKRAAGEELDPETHQPIGFGREPEEVSMKEPGQIGFREDLKHIIREFLKEDE